MAIKVYSTPTCPWCKKVKDFLKGKGVSFEDVDVSSNEDAANEMIDRSGQMGVPVIDVDGTVIVGFDTNEIEKALKKK